MDDNGLIEVPYVEVRLTTGVMSQIVKPVLAHEIPILMTTLGEEAVQVNGATGDTRWLYPDEEYGRLASRYGSNKSGSNVTEEVFGKRMEGRLEDLMERALKMFPLPSAEEVKEQELAKEPEKAKVQKKGRSRKKAKSKS